MTSPDRPFRASGPETQKRLITAWSRGGGAVDLHHLIPAASNEAVARFYRVDGGVGETMLWVEDCGPDAHSLEGQAPVGLAASAEMFRFTLVRDVGVVSATPAPWLYIVHTDIPDDIVDDYNAWYDEEHLPRLVGVPGIERARRYVANSALSPRYLTAYDLTIKDAFESPAGLKARKTPWTEKMRSLFFNTRRKMCAFQAEGSSLV
jgi:hypothetical protein